MARPAQITQNNKFAKSLLYLKKELRDEGDFLCSWASQFSVNWYCHFWWVLLGTTKVLKITSMQCLKNWVIKLMFLHADKHESLLKVDSIIFDGFGQACPNYLGKFEISLWYLKEEVRNAVLSLQFIIHPMHSYHWPFFSLSMSSMFLGYLAPKFTYTLFRTKTYIFHN